MSLALNNWALVFQTSINICHHPSAQVHPWVLHLQSSCLGHYFMTMTYFSVYWLCHFLGQPWHLAPFLIKCNIYNHLTKNVSCHFMSDIYVMVFFFFPGKELGSSKEGNELCRARACDGDHYVPKDYIQVKSFGFKTMDSVDCLLLWNRLHPHAEKRSEFI